MLPKLRDRRDQYLLRQLVKSHENHKIMNKWHKNFFQYLDRYYVKYHALPTLEEAGIRHFKTLVFDRVKTEVCSAIIALIDEEREGASVDRDLVRLVTLTPQRIQKTTQLKKKQQGDFCFFLCF